MIDNYEAEVSVLGSVLLEGELFETLHVREEHFHHPAHRHIYRAMAQARERGESIDLVVVTTNLGDRIEQIGGTAYLLKLTESVASTSNLGHHEQLIFDAYRLRKSSELAREYSARPSEKRMGQLIEHLGYLQHIGSMEPAKSISDYLLEITEEMIQEPETPVACATSYNDLDEMTGGLQKGDLVVVAARPSVGKTAFSLNLAAENCRNGGMSTIFSLEMGTKALLKRMISAEGRVNGEKWRGMAFSKADYERAFHAIGVISDWGLAIFDDVQGLHGIRAAIRRRVHDDPEVRHLFVIDYLQLMRPGGKSERRDLEIGEITRELKLLALELDVPIVLLSQLSRGVEARRDKRPLMSDLRESGNIEQDADVIMFLYRDDYYIRESDGDTIEIIISKQRNGPVGTVELGFHKAYGRFVDV